MEKKEHPIWRGVFSKEDGTIIGRRGKPLSATKHHTGYMVATICSEGRQRQFRIHRFVYECFYGVIKDESKVINHKDGNKENNHIRNLELVTHSENADHAFEMGLRKPLESCEVHNAKLSNGSAIEVFEMVLDGYSNEEIGDKHGLHPNYVSLIRHKRRWKKLWRQFEVGCAEGSTIIP